MSAGLDEPALQRRRLRTELRRLRLDANLTQRDVARSMEWHPSKVIRIENGTVGVQANDLRALVARYGITDEQRVEELLEMARVARREELWTEFRDVYATAFLTYLNFESSATTRRNFEPLLVPGLLQTEEYARAVLTGTYQLSPDEIDLAWRARQRRQEVHERDDPPQMWFVLDEAVIRRDIGSRSIMRRQLERIRDLSKRKYITVWIIPFGVGAHPGMRGPFVLLEFEDPSDDDFVYVEHATGDSTTHDEPEMTGPYKERFFHLEELALSEEESTGLLSRAIEKLRE
jgi:transcriptional regulator with XRE-family HTH domain